MMIPKPEILRDKKIEVLLDTDFRTAYSGHIAEYNAIRDAQRDDTYHETMKAVVKWLKEHRETWMEDNKTGEIRWVSRVKFTEEEWIELDQLTEEEA